MTSLSINEKIGIKICFLRKRLKYSQEKLGELANLSKNSIGAIERGESKPSIETLERIANALNIELKELVDVSKLEF